MIQVKKIVLSLALIASFVLLIAVSISATEPMLVNKPIASPTTGVTIEPWLPPNPTPPLTPEQNQFTINFYAGWNMFSAPLKYEYSFECTPYEPCPLRVEKPIATTAFPYLNGARIVSTTCDQNAPAWYYEPSTKHYVRMPALTEGYFVRHGIGLWVKMPFACSITVEGSEFELNQFLLPGWNQVGAPLKSVSIFDVENDCEITSGPWEWSALEKKYVKSSLLKAGKGYWVKVMSACTLQEAPPQPPEPSPTPTVTPTKVRYVEEAIVCIRAPCYPRAFFVEPDGTRIPTLSKDEVLAQLRDKKVSESFLSELMKNRASWSIHANPKWKPNMVECMACGVCGGPEKYGWGYGSTKTIGLHYIWLKHVSCEGIFVEDELQVVIE